MQRSIASRARPRATAEEREERRELPIATIKGVGREVQVVTIAGEKDEGAD